MSATEPGSRCSFQQEALSCPRHTHIVLVGTLSDQELLCHSPSPDTTGSPTKDGMTRDPLSSSADDPRRCQTVELEEAPCDDRNGI
jgi:hypothetical protein